MFAYSNTKVLLNRTQIKFIAFRRPQSLIAEHKKLVFTFWGKTRQKVFLEHTLLFFLLIL